MMIRMQSFFLACFIIGMIMMTTGYAQVERSASERMIYSDVYGSPTGIAQVYEAMSQLAKSVGDIPPDMERIAVYSLRYSPRDFSPGMARFIRGKVEDVLMKVARKKVVIAPELRTNRIISTDSTFQFANTIPNLDELWALSDKLKIDGFIEGNVTKSEDGDVLLNLRLIKSKTAEIMWSGSFVAGPNKQKEFISNLEFATTAGFRLYKAKALDDVVTRFDIYHFSLEAQLAEAASAERKAKLSFFMGAGWLIAIPKNNDSAVKEIPTGYALSTGAEMDLVLIDKDNIDNGYWASLYGGGRFLVFQKMFMVNGGLKSQFSRHMSLKFGVNYFPLNKVLQIAKAGQLLTDGGYRIELKETAYEMQIQYTF